MEQHGHQNRFKNQLTVTQDLMKIFLKRDERQIILFPIQTTGGPKALEKHKLTNDDWKWNSPDHVNLPMSSLYTKIKTQNMKSVPRWEIIDMELTKFISNAEHEHYEKLLHRTIMPYNSYIKSLNFDNLIHVKHIVSSWTPRLYQWMAEEALKLPLLLHSSIPLLKRGDHKTIYMTQRQALAILANGFFCTFPNTKASDYTFQNYPGINFHGLFHRSPESWTENKTKVQKLILILKYFETMMTRPQRYNTIISYERRQLHSHQIPQWKNSTVPLCKVGIGKGDIAQAKGMIQVEFANKYVGGGVLRNGALMEELRFCICPELIVSRLFTEKLTDKEVLIITGCEQFTSYTGYGHDFRYAGPFCDQTNVDSLGRRDTVVVAIDALKFESWNKSSQFSIENVGRELNKSYCAFRPRYGEMNLKPVATGNWGCGAFNGDPDLKFVIQWIAVSQSGRPGISMYTFGDTEQEQRISNLANIALQKNLSVQKALDMIDKFGKKKNAKRETLCQYMFRKLK